MNPMQKYPHITESFACTQKMLAIMFLFLTNSLISSGTSSTPKLSKWTISFLLQIKQSNVCLHLHIHQGLLRMPHPLFFKADYFLNKHHWISVRFDNIFLIQNLLKDEEALKIPIFSITSFYNSFSFFVSRTSSYNSFSC